MKFQNPDLSENTLYSENMMNPGCKLNWGANITLVNAQNGQTRLGYFNNNENIKEKNIQVAGPDTLNLHYKLEAPEIEEQLQVNMVWSLEAGKLELRPAFDMRSPNAGLNDW